MQPASPLRPGEGHCSSFDKSRTRLSWVKHATWERHAWKRLEAAPLLMSNSSSSSSSSSSTGTPRCCLIASGRNAAEQSWSEEAGVIVSHEAQQYKHALGLEVRAMPRRRRSGRH
jgi:hypothetical protein